MRGVTGKSELSFTLSQGVFTEEPGSSIFVSELIPAIPFVELLSRGLVNSAFALWACDDYDFVFAHFSGENGIFFQEFSVERNCGVGLRVAKGKDFALVGQPLVELGDIEHDPIGCEVILISNAFSIIAPITCIEGKNAGFAVAFFPFSPSCGYHTSVFEHDSLTDQWPDDRFAM